MKNLVIRVEGDKLIMEVDLKQEFGPSSSGKSITIASSEGNVAVQGDVKIGVNVYKSVPKAAR